MPIQTAEVQSETPTFYDPWDQALAFDDTRENSFLPEHTSSAPFQNEDDE